MPKADGFLAQSRQVLPFFIALLFAGAVMAAEHSGRVVFNGRGVPGAVVTASDSDLEISTVTDVNGMYAFSDLSDAIWKVSVKMQAFASMQQEITMGYSAAPIVWELKLLPIEQIQGIIMPPAPAMTHSASDVYPATKDAKSARRKETPTLTSNLPYQRAELGATGAIDPAKFDVDGSVSFQSNSSFSGLKKEDLDLRAADGLIINGSANNSALSSDAHSRAFGNVRGGNGLRRLYNGSMGFAVNSSALDARSYSLAGVDSPKPSYNHIQGMFSFGGALQIPRLISNGPLFYFDYQFSRNRNVQTQSGLVPTIAERNGDLSQAEGQIYDPMSHVPFMGNRIPEERISREARSLLRLFPLPNIVGNSHYNYQTVVSGNTHQDNFAGNLSKLISLNDQVSSSFSIQSSRQGSATLLGFLDVSRVSGENASFNWQHRFTQKLVGLLNFQFNRRVSTTTPFFAHRENVSEMAGIHGNNQEPINWGPPDITFYSGLSPLADALPSFSRVQTSILKMSTYWNSQKHNISFGGEFRREQNNLLSQQNPRGAFSFTGASTQAPGGGLLLPGARNDFAGFLLGIPDTAALAFGNADKYFRSSGYNAYAADDWRVNPSLSVNVGIRWEYSSPVSELYGRLVNLDVKPGFLDVVPVTAQHPVGSLTGIHYPKSLMHPFRFAFQPRVGFSWRPFENSSIVVRGGYGIYYDSSPYLSLAMEMSQQSPLSKSLSLQNSDATPLTLAAGFNAPANVSSNVFSVDPDLRVGYVHVMQLSTQYDLPYSLQLTAGYQGNRGRRALQSMLPNTYPLGAANPCPSCPSGFKYLASNGTSSRDAGTIQLRRRLTAGFTASLQYVYSKSIDDAAPGGMGVSGNASIAQDWMNPRAEKALSNFDRRHVASIQLQFTTGIGASGGTLIKGLKGALYKGWTVSSQIDAASGMPQSPQYPMAIQGAGITGVLRPDYTGADIYAAPAGLHLNPAAYAAPAGGRWGNAGRNTIRGPSQFSLNASLGRDFRISDQASIEISITANNALNHVSFSSWNSVLGNAQFGLPTSANAMRSVMTSIRWRF